MSTHRSSASMSRREMLEMTGKTAAVALPVEHVAGTTVEMVQQRT